MLPSPENVECTIFPCTGCFGGTQCLNHPGESLWASKAYFYIISLKVEWDTTSASYLFIYFFVNHSINTNQIEKMIK